jgi:hypothetical protein
MQTESLIRNLIICAISFSVFSCRTEVILPGILTGLVTDAETSESLQAALVKLDPSNDTNRTGNDGIYQFKSLEPGYYNIEV